MGSKRFGTSSMMNVPPPKEKHDECVDEFKLFICHYNEYLLEYL